MAEITDKRVLERELHRKGRVFQAEIERAKQSVPDFADRACWPGEESGGLGDTLVAEKTVRDQRIERIMSEPPPKPAGFPVPVMEIEE